MQKETTHGTKQYGLHILHSIPKRRGEGVSIDNSDFWRKRTRFNNGGRCENNPTRKEISN